MQFKSSKKKKKKFKCILHREDDEGLSTWEQDHFFCNPLYSTWRAALHRPLFLLDPFLQRSVTPHQSQLHNLCKKDRYTVHDFCFLQSSCCTRDDLGTSECNIQVSTAGGAQELTLNQHSSATSTISAMTLYDRNSKSRIHLVFCSKFSQDLIVSFLLIAFLHNFSGSCEFLSTKLKTTFSYAK